MRNLLNAAAAVVISMALVGCGSESEQASKTALTEASEAATSALEASGQAATDSLAAAGDAASAAVTDAQEQAKQAVESAGQSAKDMITSAGASATAALASAAPDLAAGEATYGRFCFSCHAAGVAGAPKLGNADDWGPRVAKGLDALVASTIEGIPPGMPARGLCMNCSDDDLRNTVAWMIAQ